MTSRSMAVPAGTADSEARRQGRQDGYEQGYAAGRHALGVAWPGTSIIIPTYNKRAYLEKCLNSIFLYTADPFEIIVVDNASTDDTSTLLESLAIRYGFGKIRYRILEENLGFAGAVNRGLMMARGERLLLLNNDTIVTENWLDNMISCLDNSPSAGIVGPVTNFISGSQLVKPPYRTIQQMHAWARSNNKSDPGRWRETERLTGFCMLMRRELLQNTGYFDEGYRIGNYEDDDYGLRVRLQNQRLLVAGDSFIHHYGSVTVRASGQAMVKITETNRQYYESKWQDVAGLLHPCAEIGLELHSPRGEAAYYPGGVVAEGADDTRWWLENGCRWKLDGSWELPLIRLSRFVLSQYRLSPSSISAANAVQRWRGSSAAPPLPDEEPSAGNDAAKTAFSPPYTVMLEGSLMYVEGGCRRPVLNALAAERWGLQLKPLRQDASLQVEALPAGLPIIAPPLLFQRL